ncbi:Oil body-associated protein 1A [Linum perenne]
MTRQVEAHHFCGHLNEEVRQCLIFNSSESDARLIGVEYIITEPLFATLPERQDLEKVAKTYGKTIHFWQVDRGDNLPLGIPQIMFALTREGQLYDELAQGTDLFLRFG